MRPLILKIDNKNVFFKFITDTDIECYYKVKINNIFLKVTRKYKLPFFKLFLGKWKSNLDSYDTVILFDNGYSSLISKYIKKKNSNIRVILWFWNPVTEQSKKFLNDKYVDEIWTYDKNDAEKYKLKYNTQFYTKNLKIKNVAKKQDILFLGREKGRKQDIDKLKEICNKQDIKFKAFIISNEKDYVSYEKYIEYLQESEAILELIKENIRGLTLRTLEALFLKKKLITNNKDIVNFDFYNPSNIFVLGIDELENLKEFLNKPYENIDQKVINYYDFEEWLKRFEVNDYEF